jgi:hypothetical protein
MNKLALKRADVTQAFHIFFLIHDLLVAPRDGPRILSFDTLIRSGVHLPDEERRIAAKENRDNAVFGIGSGPRNSLRRPERAKLLSPPYSNLFIDITRQNR